jgi:hypothetical protein
MAFQKSFREATLTNLHKRDLSSLQSTISIQTELLAEPKTTELKTTELKTTQMCKLTGGPEEQKMRQSCTSRSS